MGILGFAFAAGILIWWFEQRELAADRQPAPCHICWVFGEFRMVCWSGGQWVHADNGQAMGLTAEAAERGITPHHASPRTYEDSIGSTRRPAGAPRQWQ